MIKLVARVVILGLLGIGMDLAQPQNVQQYSQIGYDQGTTVPGTCRVPSLFWNTSTSRLSTCVTINSPQGQPGTFTLVPVGAGGGSSVGAVGTTQLSDGASGFTAGPVIGTSANNLVELNGSAQLPAVSGALLTNLPGGSTRTYPYVFQGAVQAGVAGFAFNLPATSAPTPTNSGGTMPIAALEWPTTQSTYYAWATWILPAGYTSNAAISYSLESRCQVGTCDSTNANIVTLGWACAAAVAADAPTVTDVTPFNIINSAASVRKITTGTITPTCAAGNRVWIRMIIDTQTHTLTGAFDLLSATFSVTGSI